MSDGEIAVLHSALPFLPHLSQPVTGRIMITTHTPYESQPTNLNTEARKG